MGKEGGQQGRESGDVQAVWCGRGYSWWVVRWPQNTHTPTPSLLDPVLCLPSFFAHNRPPSLDNNNNATG